MEENILKLGAAIFLFILFWLIWLSFLVFQTLNHYNKLTKGIVALDLKSILESLLKNQTLFSEEIENLKVRCATIESQSLYFLQKIKFLRFNPFSDTGGDQSFVLAILDGLKNGIIINSLHSRTGTRWYAKKIKKGKSEEYELSGEEEKILSEHAV